MTLLAISCSNKTPIHNGADTFTLLTMVATCWTICAMVKMWYMEYGNRSNNEMEIIKSHTNPYRPMYIYIHTQLYTHMYIFTESTIVK